MIVKGSCELSLTRAELVELLAKLYLLDDDYSAFDSVPSNETAKVIAKKCSVLSSPNDFSLTLTGRQGARLFSLLEKAADKHIPMDVYRHADTTVDDIAERCSPDRFKLTPSEREFYMSAIDALEKSVGQRVTIRELSNQAGVQYEPFRRLVKRLEHIGYIERFGKLTASFDRDRAMELLHVGCIG